MNRRDTILTIGAVAGAAAGLFVFIQRRHEAKRRTPDWKDPGQPVEGTGGLAQAHGIPTVPSPAASWAAVRPGSPRLQAGSRIMRTYAGNLVDDPESLVR
jgi:hypothetical protein